MVVLFGLLASTHIEDVNKHKQMPVQCQFYSVQYLNVVVGCVCVCVCLNGRL